VIPEHKVLVPGNYGFVERVVISKLSLEVRFLDFGSVHEHITTENLDLVTGDSHDALDKRFIGVSRVPKDHDIAPMDILKAVDKSIYEDPLLVYQARLHTRSFDLHRLDQKDHDKHGSRDRKDDVAKPGFQF
jgi:hypothetical protein